jgi:hypothetical protein
MNNFDIRRLIEDKLKKEIKLSENLTTYKLFNNNYLSRDKQKQLEKYNSRISAFKEILESIDKNER